MWTYVEEEEWRQSTGKSGRDPGHRMGNSHLYYHPLKDPDTEGITVLL